MTPQQGWLNGVAVAPRSKVGIESTVYAAREAMGLPPGGPLSGEKLFDAIGQHPPIAVGLEAFLPHGLVEELPDGELGKTKVRGDRILVMISEQQYSQLESGGRALFTLAHEIGHMVMHSAELVRRAQLHISEVALMRAQVRTHRTFEDSEWQANYFAGALLLPEPEVKALHQRVRGRQLVFLLAERFGVSIQCAENRIRALGLSMI